MSCKALHKQAWHTNVWKLRKGIYLSCAFQLQFVMFRLQFIVFCLRLGSLVLYLGFELGNVLRLDTRHALELAQQPR